LVFIVEQNLVGIDAAVRVCYAILSQCTWRATGPMSWRHPQTGST